MNNPVAPRFDFDPSAELPEVTASVLKNNFSEVARQAANGPVAISRHNRRVMVILTAEQYEELRQSHRVPLESLAAKFDAMVAKMNTPEDRAARRKFFQASAVRPGAALSGLEKDLAHAG